MLIYQRGFSGGNEEQDLRIRLFENLGCLKVLKPQDLTSKNLAETIVNSLKNSLFPDINIKIKGVQKSIDLILDLIKTNN